ncbi:translation initiation factor eIF2B subunit beta isoform X4 [Procambarus clarkii]|uniref:translation initiation factor eIF2B subunit beta isoform X4 n=1 Tax=Procambarus clarkii TaxID=6728 RepID=UPI001E672A51|nr:translation initiation factor eIF-2B subunit beta-like [Procambarus clarkii]
MAPISEEAFIEKLRFEKFESEQAKAEESLVLLEHVVANSEWQTGSELLDLLRNVVTAVRVKMPWETTPCNMVQRVIKIVIDEYNACREVSEGGGYQSLKQMMFVDPASGDLPECTETIPELRNRILEVLAEHKAEIEQSQELIAVQGESKIHNDEVIMTCGMCPMVLAFLTKAAKRRKFHVIVAECAPKYDGHQMAKSLCSANIQTTLIQDCAVFPMMSRVNKVIIGTQTVLSNGGIKTFVGAAPLASAAKFYSVPLYVCTPTYKFSLESSEEVNHCGSRNVVVPPNSDIPSSVNVMVAKFDYVPPENVTSFITNNRGIAPSYVYRQLSELYHPTSYDL